MVSKKIILASTSPRRRILLQQIGFSFEIQESNIAEVHGNGVAPEVLVKNLAYQKASAVAAHEQNAIIIGADTVVVIDNSILGKPKDTQDAIRMLSTLSGRTHNVYTGFSIVDRPSDQFVSDVEVTKVTFRPMTPDEIHSYVQSGSPMDKAGAYGIQDDFGAVFIERIEGCFYNVVGFPLSKFYTRYQQFQQQLMHL